MIVYLDGPEKAGKTTIVKTLTNEYIEKWQSTIVKQSGRARPDSFVYLKQLIEAISTQFIHIWDRGWISEAVYGRMLDEKKRRVFARNNWLGEWFLTRLTVGKGGSFIVLPEDPERLEVLRDGSDLPIDPFEEYRAWWLYAHSWGVQTLTNKYDRKSLTDNCKVAAKSVFVNSHGFAPHEYIGPKKPKVIFVSEHLSKWSPTDYDDVYEFPFYDQFWYKVFQPFGRRAINDFGYTTIPYVDRLNAPLFIAFGEKAGAATAMFGHKVVEIPSFAVAPYYERFLADTIWRQI